MPTENGHNEKRKEEVEIKVKEFYGKLKGEHDFLQQYLLGSSVLFLSCDKDVRQKAKEILDKENKYTAFVVEDFKPMFPFLPEFEIEKRAIDFADIIIVVEPKNKVEIERCSGLVQECMYIMQNKKLQEKTICIVCEELPHEKITSIKELHYVYFPNIYRMCYSDKNALINCCASLAKKEIHRNALMLLNSNKAIYKYSVNDIYDEGKVDNRERGVRDGKK